MRNPASTSWSTLSCDGFPKRPGIPLQRCHARTFQLPTLSIWPRTSFRRLVVTQALFQSTTHCAVALRCTNSLADLGDTLAALAAWRVGYSRLPIKVKVSRSTEVCCAAGKRGSNTLRIDTRAGRSVCAVANRRASLPVHCAAAQACWARWASACAFMAPDPIRCTHASIANKSHTGAISMIIVRVASLILVMNRSR